MYKLEVKNNQICLHVKWTWWDKLCWFLRIRSKNRFQRLALRRAFMLGVSVGGYYAYIFHKIYNALTSKKDHFILQSLPINDHEVTVLLDSLKFISSIEDRDRMLKLVGFHAFIHAPNWTYVYL